MIGRAQEREKSENTLLLLAGNFGRLKSCRETEGIYSKTKT
jgi:hypothetical protein